MPKRVRTDRPFAAELPDLLDARAEAGAEPRSLRALAEQIGVNQSYLSRVLGAKGARPVSKDVAAKAARAFGLPADYFPEYRAAAVVDAARQNPTLLDPVYDKLAKKRR